MSGFLANLLSRSTGRISAIRPRLASLFEPQCGAAGPPVDLPSREPTESWDAFRIAARENSDVAATDPVVREGDRVARPKPYIESPAPISIPRTTTPVPHAEIIF